MRALIPLFLASALAACGGAGGHFASSSSRSAPLPAGAVAPPAFDDSHPVTDWAGGPVPQSYPVHGIDVARFQDSIDWSAARAGGVTFAFIKATEGGDRVDAMFRDHWRGAGRAGVHRGAYHFFYHCRPAVEQAHWFIRHVPKERGNLPPVLDLEWTPTSPTCTIRRDGATIRSEARAFLDIVARHYGRRPIVYTTIDFYRDNELWKLTGADFWFRAVASHPHELYEGRRWLFWQYSSTGIVPGVGGATDVNVFAGSAEAWRAFADGGI